MIPIKIIDIRGARSYSVLLRSIAISRKEEEQPEPLVEGRKKTRWKEELLRDTSHETVVCLVHKKRNWTVLHALTRVEQWVSPSELRLQALSSPKSLEWNKLCV